MPQSQLPPAAIAVSPATLRQDLTGGIVVFLVALPLCLGIALASGAPPISGLIAGIIGGLVIGSLSGSHTSVSGPAAGLTTIVASQIANLGSFEAFLLAVFVGGIVQVTLGLSRAGSLSSFFPSSVIKGLLAAIGIILILKQIPHLVGHDSDPEGEMSFAQPDDHNTFSELLSLITGDIHLGATIVGVGSLLLLLFWNRISVLKKSILPAPLVVVLFGVLLHGLLAHLSDTWAIGKTHLVQIPFADPNDAGFGFLRFPDWSQLVNPAIYIGGITIAVVASLETLLNLEAVDKIDPQRRTSPASRELLAQGAGNMLAGLIGGLPTTSVIIRSSVNVNIGAKTKLSTIFHGLLLVLSVLFFPVYLNMIPLAALAAILLATGFKLASPKLFVQIWREGPYQFLPFVATLVSIVFTDLLIGILVGLAVSVVFILRSNFSRPVRTVTENHLNGEVVHLQLANQVTFLNRASVGKILKQLPPGTNLLIDGSDSDFIDPDVLSLIREFRTEIAPVHHISVNLRGFRRKYQLEDTTEFETHSTSELQMQLTPREVLDILRDGNRRFYANHRLFRDLNRLVKATSEEPNPLAVVLSGIDSRVSPEVLFDLGIGDIVGVRVAGNVTGEQALASIEYAVQVSGVRLVVVLGNTRCEAVSRSVDLLSKNGNGKTASGGDHLSSIVKEIGSSVPWEERKAISNLSGDEKEKYIDEVATRNVLRTVDEIIKQSQCVRTKLDTNNLLVIGALYNVTNGRVKFLQQNAYPKTLLATG